MKLLREICSAALFLCLADLAVAQNNSKNNRSAVLTKKGAASELPKVTKVKGEQITVGKKTYQVTSFTRITVNGKKASLSEIEPGMQASVAGGVLRYGRTKGDTLYKATRISAKSENDLEGKRKEFNKKQSERAKTLNQQARRNQRRRSR